ncbi:MAG TPA: HD domain-containing protein [Stellaceae bacterium]|nr:HD domain-containing protein [Stellaceae bacterium]
MDVDAALFAGYPALANVVNQLNTYLESEHPSVFGPAATHPLLPAKRSKVIHDNLWGTVRFSWRELTLIDSPLMQRLRDVHQTGLAFHVYPSARHSRFEHCLGAANIASRVFDALLHKQRDEIRDIARAVNPGVEPDKSILRFKQELRLAALLHDIGHSLFSHTSERVYEELGPLVEASKELTSFVGKQKGAGEVLSFCMVLTPAVRELLTRAEGKLIGDTASDDYEGAIDLKNVALIIVGRSTHPFLQFLGDIVSSGFDADKLDYLLRDAKAAGLPLSYDIDRYLYDVRVKTEILADGNDQLEKLYSHFDRIPARSPASSQTRFPYYETYRLRLSRRAMNVIEQIVICKMMLFSYIYHHGKVRASEGLLERLLRRRLSAWRASGVSDSDGMIRFLRMTDASLRQIATDSNDDPIIQDYSYRLVNRLVPREVYGISGPSATHAAGVIIRDFLLKLNDRRAREKIVPELEAAIGEELINRCPELGTDAAEAIAKAGVWVDAPKPPKFEDVDTMVSGSSNVDSGVPIAQVFPIREWTEAYEHYRYQVRIFALSEFRDATREAAKAAMTRVLGISGQSFYDSIRRDRR